MPPVPLLFDSTYPHRVGHDADAGIGSCESGEVVVGEYWENDRVAVVEGDEEDDRLVVGEGYDHSVLGDVVNNPEVDGTYPKTSVE